MRKAAIFVSALGLLLTLLPSVLVFAGAVSSGTHKNLMVLGMLLWFGTAPLWLGKKSQAKT